MGSFGGHFVPPRSWRCLPPSETQHGDGPIGFVVKKGSKIRNRAPAESPGPVLETTSATSVRPVGALVSKKASPEGARLSALARCSPLVVGTGRAEFHLRP
jgi:hypothetical protein